MNPTTYYDCRRETMLLLSYGEKHIFLYGCGPNGKSYMLNELKEYITEKKYSMSHEFDGTCETSRHITCITAFDQLDYVTDPYDIVDMSTIVYNKDTELAPESVKN